MSTPNDICITGMGIISAVGIGVEESVATLKSGKTGIGPVNHLKTVHKELFPVGEVKKSNAELLDILKLPASEMDNVTRTALLGMVAAQQAIEDAKISSDVAKNVAVISGTSVGGMDKTELLFRDEEATADFVYTHPCGDSTDKIAAHIGSTAYRTTISTACSSAANAVIHAARLIKSGKTQVALAGGSDALSKFTLNGFNSLMILDKELCKPFDENRKGLNLGEGSAFLVLETRQSAEERGAKIYCTLTGYANSNDAYHQTASSPQGEGAFLAMTGALALAGLSPEDITYINVHGTGTSNNDLSEGIAMKRIFGENVPPFSSTKSYTGHTLGAAAAVEAIFSVLSVSEGFIYPNLHFEEPIAELSLTPVTAFGTAPVHHVLSNSFGFGGNNSTLIFSK